MRRPARRMGLVLASLTAVVGLAGCGTDAGDFVREGEKFLESDEMARAAGYRLVGARCEPPDSVALGTIYRCTATDERGYSWLFDLEITGDRELTVQDVYPAPGSTWND